MQITIQKVWPLTPGKANGGFVGTDGKNYKCEAATLGVLQEGMTLDVNVKPSEWQGKTFYWLPRGYMPPRDSSPAPTSPPYPPTNTNQPSPPPVQRANGAAPAFVPEMERQGYIMCSVIMKILADAQTQSGNPPNTEDMALFAQCATTVWRDHLKGKV